MTVGASPTPRSRHDRVADVYDAFEGVMEGLAYHRWRTLVWDHVEGDRILEIGVGTGKNLPYHPAGKDITAIDLSSAVLAWALRKRRGRSDVHFAQMDVQALGFPDDTFDTVVGTFVFASVADPAQGLREARRVLRPGGWLVLLEQVLSPVPVLSQATKLLNPVVVALMGANIDRRTDRAVRQCDFEMEEVWDLGVGGIFKLIVARKEG